MAYKHLLLLAILYLSLFSICRAEDEASAPTVDDDIGKSRDGSRTDDEAVAREEEAIKIDGLNVSQLKELREKADKSVFQAEVSRMMKLIINSLYRNKEIFLRELISNSSDALDKIRFLSLTDKNVLGETQDLVIRIKADKENRALHITDTGIGMTREELEKNLGTIAKSGTSDFFDKMREAGEKSDQASDLIGQFGVGFYSAFLVADTVVVTSKHNDDKQYIWQSDSAGFTIAEDPRGNTLGRGTTVSLYLKEEAQEYLELESLKTIIKKYSQFINFSIYLWSSKVESVEEPVEEESTESDTKKEDKGESDDDVQVEEEKEEQKPKTKTVEKTVWDWELMNGNKPIWTRSPKDVDDTDYDEFYKQFSKDSEAPLTKTHFVAEGEVTFRSLLFVPQKAPYNFYQEFGKKVDNIKLYVRRVFITDNFEDMMPRYLAFIRGVVDSDDLPLNVSRETLQQHKLLKVIKKKLVRKALDMLKKMDVVDFEKFWKEFGTSLKLGIMEDHSNRTRIAKLLRFYSSYTRDDEMTSLTDYIERMKDKQEQIYYVGAQSRKEAEASPFVERLIKKNYEVLYLTEAVDEYAIQSLPEFEGKKFQNVAKEGLKIGEETERAKDKQKALDEKFKPLTDWMKDKGLKDQIEKATISQRLSESPCALVASSYGWAGNMERIMKAQAYAKSDDPNTKFFATQKKTLELNPFHPLVKELLSRIEKNADDKNAKDIAHIMFDTAALRSGFALEHTSDYASRIERMLRLSVNVDPDAPVEADEEFYEEVESTQGSDDSADPQEEEADDSQEDNKGKDEL